MTGINFVFARSVVEEREVEKIVEEESKKYPRLSDIFEGLKWRLARKPDSGYLISIEPEKWLFKTYPWAVDGAAVITVIYSFDQNTVTLEAIKVTSINED